MDSERDRREEELRRESARSQAAESPAEPTRVRRTSEPRVERLSEEDARRARFMAQTEGPG